MYIGRILLKGFKSFGGNHELLLPPGMTAIVGPNGSGKSNILDALRWALGETNPGRLRILRQNDLLFQGSASLPPSSSSEVMIQLRSGSGMCSIRRKWMRDEGSHLLVDGARVRLQDLQDVKREWKLEGDRFAFIGQGEIAEVIQQRPAQRRVHLETLFGIDLYRKRREDAAQRLDNASTEMVRLETLSAELQNRRKTIAPLVVQARKARDITEQLEKAHGRLYMMKRARAERAIEAAESVITRLEAERRSCRYWEQGWAKKTRSLEKAGPGLEGELEAIEQELESTGERLSALKREMFALAASLRDGRMESGRLKKERDDRKKVLEKREEELTEAQAALQEALKEEQARREEKEWLDRLEEDRRLEIRRVMEETQRLKERKGRIEGGLGRLRAELAQTGSYFREVRQSLGESRERALSVQDNLDRARGERERAEAGLADAVARHNDAYAACQENVAAVQVLRRDITKMEAAFEDLQDRLQSRAYPPPLRHLLAAKRLGRLKVEMSPLADAIDCPARLSTAVEAFLGGRLYWVLVENLESAGACIERLKEAEAGRATFLPLERSRPKHPERRFDTGREGVVGWAAELLSLKGKWEPALLHVLGDLLIVTDYETAKSAARSGARFPLVTLEGDVFNPSGTVAGGGKRKEPGALGLGREIADLEASLEEARARMVKLRRDGETLEERERLAAELRADLEDESRKAAQRERELENALAREEREKARLDGELEKASRGLEGAGTRYLAGVREIRDIGKALEAFPVPGGVPDPSGAEQARSRLELARERLRAAREIHGRVLSDRDRMLQEVRSSENSLEAVARRMQEAAQKLGILGADHLEGKRVERGLSEKRYRLRESLRRIQESRERARRRLELAVERMRGAGERLSAAMQKKASAEAELSETKEMWEDRFPYFGSGSVDPSGIESVRKRARELETALKALKDADLGVLSEDRSLEERLQFLSKQLDDVRQGMNDLRRFISETDEQAGKLFSESLGRIGKSFSSLFQRLFGGGEAELRLSDGEDVWSAGVEVLARPPGKRPQHLGQLSGGEQSLSAISLLFASMEVAEVPLGILDEVDAALDEVNLRRFSDLAREYSSRMQLVCMTHRRVTMERADVMYGVTLSEPGLSQLVSVKLEDWD